MKKCKSCKAEIPNDAKKCSHCGTDQRGWAKRHPILTGIAIVIIAIIILSTIGGGSKDGSTSTGSTTNTDQPAKMAKIGEVVKDNDLSFVVNSMTTAQSLGNSFSAKQAQGQFYIVNVTVKNGSKATQTVNSSDFKLIDEQGRTFEPSTDGMTAKSMAEGKTDFFLQQVQPGLDVTSDLVFDAPADAEGLKLQVQGSLFSNGQSIELGK